MDQEIVEMVRYLDPEIVEKVDKSFMCKKELTRFSARLRIQDGAECGNIYGRLNFHQN